MKYLNFVFNSLDWPKTDIHLVTSYGISFPNEFPESTLCDDTWILQYKMIYTISEYDLKECQKSQQAVF